MLNRVSHVSIVVRDQQEALEWFTEKLGFEVVADETLEGREGRWLTVAPPAQAELEIVLEPRSWGLVGQEPKDVGHDGLVFGVDDCRDTVEELRRRGVEIVSEPEELPWGVSALFEDLYGNVHNIVEPYPADTGVPDVA